MSSDQEDARRLNAAVREEVIKDLKSEVKQLKQSLDDRNFRYACMEIASRVFDRSTGSLMREFESIHSLLLGKPAKAKRSRNPASAKNIKFWTDENSKRLKARAKATKK